MRAVLIATGFKPAMRPWVDRKPTPLLPVAGKPFIHHVVESLVERGITDFDIILRHLPYQVEESLGDGERWGCRFRYHLAADSERAWDRVRTLSRNWTEERVLIGNADVLPQWPSSWPEQPLALFDVDGGDWSGWAVLPCEPLRQIPKGADDAVVEQFLLSQATDSTRFTIPQSLDVRDWQALFRANQAVIRGDFTGPTIPGREVEPGIWLSRNVSLHPNAHLKAPVFIGENTQIGSGAVVGPGTAVGAGCIVAERSTVQNAIVCSDTYVGEALELQESVVDHNCLISIPLNTAITLREQFLLGNLKERTIARGLARWLERGAAWAATILLTPIALPSAALCALTRRGPLVHEIEAVALPSEIESHAWQTFSFKSFGAGERAPAERNWIERWLHFSRLDFYPALGAIRRGELHFVGVQPRRVMDVLSLPEDWRVLYLSAQAGIATLSEVEHGEQVDRDHQYTADAFFAVQNSPGFNLRLFLRWLLRSKR